MVVKSRSERNATSAIKLPGIPRRPQRPQAQVAFQAELDRSVAPDGGNPGARREKSPASRESRTQTEEIKERAIFQLRAPFSKLKRNCGWAALALLAPSSRFAVGRCGLQIFSRAVPNRARGRTLTLPTDGCRKRGDKSPAGGAGRLPFLLAGRKFFAYSSDHEGSLKSTASSSRRAGKRSTDLHGQPEPAARWSPRRSTHGLPLEPARRHLDHAFARGRAETAHRLRLAPQCGPLTARNSLPIAGFFDRRLTARNRLAFDHLGGSRRAVPRKITRTGILRGRTARPAGRPTGYASPSFGRARNHPGIPLVRLARRGSTKSVHAGSRGVNGPYPTIDPVYAPRR